MGMILVFTALILLGFAIYSIKEYLNVSKTLGALNRESKNERRLFDSVHKQKIKNQYTDRPSLKSLEKKIDDIGERLVSIEKNRMEDSKNVRSISALFKSTSGRRQKYLPTEDDLKSIMSNPHDASVFDNKEQTANFLQKDEQFFDDITSYPKNEYFSTNN